MALVLMMLGAGLLLFLEVLIFKFWLSKSDHVTPSRDFTSSDGATPDLEELLSRINLAITQPTTTKIGSETAATLNVVLAFLFQEMKNNSKVRAIIISKINSEIGDIMASKLKSKLLKSLKLHNFSLGPAPPTFESFAIRKLRLDTDGKNFRKLHLGAKVIYKGGGKLAMNATTMFGKNLYISIEIQRLIGSVIFIFNNRPHSHWGFCFDNDPDIAFNVVSSIQQKSLPYQVTRFITSLIKTSISKKHTKPNYKKRYAPFFKEPSRTPDTDGLFFFKDKPVNEGTLVVKLISANRVYTSTTGGTKGPERVFCTISPARKLWDAECCPTKQHLNFDTTLSGIANEIGITFKFDADSSGGGSGATASGGAIVGSVTRSSIAHEHLIKPGDTITAINNKRITNTNSALSATWATSVGKARVSVTRPLLKLHKMATSSGDAFQDMIRFESDTIKEASFVEEEEFLVFKKFLEAECDGTESENSSNNNNTHHEGEGRDTTDDIPEVGHISCANSGEKVLRSGLQPNSITPFWDEYFLLNIRDHHKYLSVGLWRETTEEDSNAYLLGYQNLNLVDIALNCLATDAASYTDAVLLTPPPSNKWQENCHLQQPLSSIPPLVRKMAVIAGEVRLQFTYVCKKDRPRQRTCSHEFVHAHVQDHPYCSTCRYKIHHNVAMVCTSCVMAIHDKCLPLVNKRDWDEYDNEGETRDGGGGGVKTTPPSPQCKSSELRSAFRTASSGRIIRRRPKLSRQRSKTLSFLQGSTTPPRGSSSHADNPSPHLPSFFFLRGAEKRNAIIEERMSQVEETLVGYRDLRATLIRSRSQCHADHIPESLSEQITGIEHKIHELEQQKRKFLSYRIS